MSESIKLPEKIWTDEERRLAAEKTNSMLEKAHEEYEKKLGLLPREKRNGGS